MDKVGKLLEFIDNIRNNNTGYRVPIDEIKYYLDKKIDLKYTFEIREYIYRFSYYYSYNREKLYKDYIKLNNIIKKYNINPEYYGFKSYDEMVKEEMNKNEIEKHKPKKICKGYIYFIRDNNGYIKIGKTINIKNRSKKYITENANKIDIIHNIYYDSIDYGEAEGIRHSYFIKKHHNRERFKLHQIDIDYIKSFQKNGTPNL